MRSSIIGIVMGGLLLAGLFALAHYDPPKALATAPADVAAQIEPGFTGAKQIGPWLLVCAPGQKKTEPLPLSLAPYKQQAQAAGAGNAFGRCRAGLAYHRVNNPKQTVLVVNFRLLGQAQNLAVIVVLPPIVKTGDVLELRAGHKILKLPVSVCQQTKCVAVVALAPSGEADLLSEKNGVLVFPPAPDGKRGGVGVPFVGLKAAVDAMRRAET